MGFLIFKIKFTSIKSSCDLCDLTFACFTNKMMQVKNSLKKTYEPVHSSRLLLKRTSLHRYCEAKSGKSSCRAL